MVAKPTQTHSQHPRCLANFSRLAQCSRSRRKYPKPKRLNPSPATLPRRASKAAKREGFKGCAQLQTIISRLRKARRKEVLHSRNKSLPNSWQKAQINTRKKLYRPRKPTNDWQKSVLPLPNASLQPRVFYESCRDTKEQNLTGMTKNETTALFW